MIDLAHAASKKPHDRNAQSINSFSSLEDVMLPLIFDGKGKSRLGLVVVIM